MDSNEKTGAMPRPKLLSLTDKAAARIKAAIDRVDGPVAGVRIGVKNGGCAGMEYTMEYAAERAPLDEVVDDKGVTVLIDAKAVLFLIGTEMDYEVTKFRSGFVFNNPNVLEACGCGESVTIAPAERPDK